MKILKLLCILILWTTVAFAYVLPTTKDNEKLLIKKHFVVCYNTDYKIPSWTCFTITKEQINIKLPRSNNFRQDKIFPPHYQATLKDYIGSGYDRGHMIPSANIDYTNASMSDSFLLTNIAPQLASFNRNGWRYLEKRVRTLVNERDKLTIITGCIVFCKNTMKNTSVVIPEFYYKIIYDSKYQECEAYLIPHKAITKNEIDGFKVSVDLIEKILDVDFFRDLDEDIEESMEKGDRNFKRRFMK